MQQDHEAAGNGVTLRPHSETGMNDAIWPFLKPVQDSSSCNGAASTQELTSVNLI